MRQLLFGGDFFFFGGGGLGSGEGGVEFEGSGWMGTACVKIYKKNGGGFGLGGFRGDVNGEVKLL